MNVWMYLINENGVLSDCYIPGVPMIPYPLIPVRVDMSEIGI